MMEEAARLRDNGIGSRAAELYERAFQRFSALGKQQEAAEALHMAGVSYKVANDIDAASTTLEEAAHLHTMNGNPLGIGRVYRDLGITWEYAGDFQRASQWLVQSIEALKDMSSPAELGISEAKLGLVKMKEGDLDASHRLLTCGLQRVREAGHWFYEMTALLHLAEFEVESHQYSEAVTTLEACLGLIHENEAATREDRRLAQIYGLRAWAYWRLGDTRQVVNDFHSAMSHMQHMTPATRSVVYDDIHLDRLIKESSHQDPELATQIHGDIPTADRV
jgi:tetratricopeptide (TPR) repeat protein